MSLNAPRPAPATASALIAQHRWLAAVVLSYVAAGYAIDLSLPSQRLMSLRVYDDVFFVMLALYSVVFVVGYLLVSMFRVGADEPLVSTVVGNFRRRYLTAHRLGAFVITAVLVRLLTDTFMSIKPAIPLLNPFSWDEAFMNLDRAVHFGMHPWQLLQPIAGPVATTTINFFYNLWLFVLFGVVIWQAWSSNWRLRERFFLTFALSWILVGTVAATVLSSAGPCYYHQVSSDRSNPYEPLMSYLYEVAEEHPVWALNVQEALWAAHAGDGPAVAANPNDGRPQGLIASAHAAETAAQGATAEESVEKMMKGISAMPSMHVAMAVLFALVAWKTHALLGAAFTAFAVIIQIGSFHLGWHYAIDGYVGAALVAAIWLGVGRLLEGRANTTEPAADSA